MKEKWLGTDCELHFMYMKTMRRSSSLNEMTEWKVTTTSWLWNVTLTKVCIWCKGWQYVWISISGQKPKQKLCDFGIERPIYIFTYFMYQYHYLVIDCFNWATIIWIQCSMGDTHTDFKITTWGNSSHMGLYGCSMDSRILSSVKNCADLFIMVLV